MNQVVCAIFSTVLETSVWSNEEGAHRTVLFGIRIDVALRQKHTERLTCGQNFTAKLSFGFHCFPWMRKTLRQSCVDMNAS